MMELITAVNRFNTTITGAEEYSCRVGLENTVEWGCRWVRAMATAVKTCDKFLTSNNVAVKHSINLLSHVKIGYNTKPRT
jgi:hypothetical protein